MGRFQHYMDACDAGRDIEAWLEDLAGRLPEEGPRSIERHELQGSSGSFVTVLWCCSQPFGIATMLRDDHNWCVVTLWERGSSGGSNPMPAGRTGDMDPSLALVVRPDRDGDWTIGIGHAPGGFPATLEGGESAEVEFCTSAGGGRSPRVREALAELRDAILAENAETPGQAIRFRASSDPGRGVG